MMLLLLVAGLSVAAASFLVVQVATLPARQRRDLLDQAARYGTQPAAPERVMYDRATFRERVFGPILVPLASVVVRLLPRTTRESVRQRLLHAGLAQKLTPDAFLGAKGLLAILGLVFGITIGLALGGATVLLLALGASAVGFVLPDVLVNGRISNRRERIQVALPDALDLLAVCVEAGLGFDAALVKLTEHMNGPLVEEFALTLNEMRIGESRTEALKRMSARVGVAEFSAFVRAIVQADHLGTSMGSLLRVQSADARVRRHIAAEEIAMKAPIKMLFPTLLFIFPAMFIVILGPALINFSKNL